MRYLRKVSEKKIEWLRPRELINLMVKAKLSFQSHGSSNGWMHWFRLSEINNGKDEAYIKLCISPFLIFILMTLEPVMSKKTHGPATRASVTSRLPVTFHRFPQIHIHRPARWRMSRLVGCTAASLAGIKPKRAEIHS